MSEKNKIDDNETIRSQLPSELYSEIMREVENEKQKLSEQTEKLGLTSEVLSDSKPIIQALDEVARSGKSDPVATSTYQVLYNLGHQVKALDPLLGQLNLQCTNIVSNASFYGVATASTASFVNWPKNVAVPNIDNVRNKRQTFDEHEKYALMLDRLDPSLGETFRSIKSAFLVLPMTMFVWLLNRPGKYGTILLQSWCVTKRLEHGHGGQSTFQTNKTQIRLRECNDSV